MEPVSWYADRLRQEICELNLRYARGRAHVQSYGSQRVIVYAPDGRDGERHGNFFDPAYQAIVSGADWRKRLGKVHAQAKRSLPWAERRWCELDSSTSSDALLMNVFCTPGVAEARGVRDALGVDAAELAVSPVFGWKARVPFRNGRADATEVDMRWGDLLVEAKLTEGSFQTETAVKVERYRDLDAVFDRELLPRVAVRMARRREAAEFPEHYSQEFEEPLVETTGAGIGLKFDPRSLESEAVELRYAGYQLIRNVLAAYAQGCSFCLLHDERRPDLREAWFQVMAAVRHAEMRVRLKVLTWQELAGMLDGDLRDFLGVKYGIVAR